MRRQAVPWVMAAICRLDDEFVIAFCIATDRSVTLRPIDYADLHHQIIAG